MKNIFLVPAFVITTSLLSCGNAASEKTTGGEAEKMASQNDSYYFDFTVDGKSLHVKESDILTTYNDFGGKTEFKIFAGAEGEPQLVLTIPNDMSKPSSTPSGSPEAGSSIAQGSLSLQGYPQKGYTFNNYDFLANPKPAPVPDAILITASEKAGEEGRIITGTINTTTFAGDPGTDPANKPYTITGKFRIKHLFNGTKF